MTCKARQYSDQMLCDHCGLQWDMNDPDPPECRSDPPRSCDQCEQTTPYGCNLDRWVVGPAVSYEDKCKADKIFAPACKWFKQKEK